MEKIITPVLTHLLKQLQAVCIIVICKVDDSCLAAVGVEGLPQPSQSQVPLHGATWNPGISRVPSQLVVPWGLHIEVCVVQPRFPQKPRD